MCFVESDLGPCRIEAPCLATRPLFFQLAEWSEQLRPVTSVWLGAVRRRFKSGAALSSGCQRNMFGFVSPLGSVFDTGDFSSARRRSSQGSNLALH